VVPASGSRTTWHRGLPVTAAARMTVLLPGAAITHRRAADAGKAVAASLLALAITIADLAVALTSSA
jgi:uncharacterized membrane protein YhaH (DUF805 family)